MLGAWIFQVIVLLFFLTVLAYFLGEYMARVFAGKRTFLSPLFGPLERFSYKIFGVDPNENMTRSTFTWNFIVLTLVGIVWVFLLQRIQNYLPLNPSELPAIRWDSALNAAISFATGTNWLAYPSENTSYLTKMLGFGLQNFLAAASVMAVAVAFINSFVRKNVTEIGNFWVYLTRSLLYILLPLSIILAVFLISQGVPDNLHPPVHVQTLEGKEQVITQGPIASHVAIKNLGTNGGGFFTANAAHPYENPTPLTDYINILAFLLIAAAFPFAFGALIKDRSQGLAIFIVMLLFLIVGLGLAIWFESAENPLLAKLGITHGINLEGKEVRFGIEASAGFASAATATAAGAANSAIESLMPLTSLVLIVNMAIGEVFFGGVGSGFISMLFYVMLTMFLIGLMIGKSPETYGKKLGAYEMIMAVLVLFTPSIVRFILSAAALATKAGSASLGDPSFHGITSVFYAYTSTIANNGSMFAGFNTNSIFYNLTTAFAMLFGRLIVVLPALAVAGSLVRKNSIPLATRFPTNTVLFILVLASTILLLGALSFLPALVLGPILEHISGKIF